jgi:hypothetical protein
MMRSFNKRLRDIVMYNRRWCKNAVKAWKRNETVHPYRIFMSGPGGVGKTHVIKLIQNDMRKLLPLSNRIKPTDVITLVTAPTGVAAFNVGGMTIHSALLLRASNLGSEGAPLTSDKLNTLRTKLENLTLLIIDEVSMVGTDMFLNIHRRLNEIKGTPGDVWFGNVCVLVVGDLYQLPPVKQKCIFKPVKDSLARMCGSGSIFLDNFYLHELTDIMRQKDDLAFAQLLCRVRTGDITADDVALLESRNTDGNQNTYPSNALHVFAFNKDVDAHNRKKLNEIASEQQQIVIKAADDKYDSTGIVDVSKMHTSKSRSNTGGLETYLHVAIGARVMLTVNVDTADGLVNGVMGTIKAFIRNANGSVSIILVEFDNSRVGAEAKKSNKYRREHPNTIPIERHKAQYEKENKKGAQVTRTQFPLTLAWAVTIHKCQGLTLNEIVVDFSGSNRFNNGQAYVALSRVQSLNGLHILNFNKSAIRADKNVKKVMEDFQRKQIPVIQHLEFISMETRNKFTVGHLNIHYFLEKQKDMIAAYNVYKYAMIMCFTETYLKKNHSVNSYLTKFDYISYRVDVPQNITNKHGVMVCVAKHVNSQMLTLIRTEYIEYCAAMVEIQNKQLIVCAIYANPASNTTSKVRELKSIMSSFPKDTLVIFTGDFNCDLGSRESITLANFFQERGYHQYVNRATTDYGSSLDHVYFNGNNVGSLDVLDTYFSDHDSVFITVLG